MSRRDEIIAQAALAATMLSCRIMDQLAVATVLDRSQAQRRLRQSIEIAEELLTRLETAEFELATTPLEEPAQ
jgi:hypothetical protein